MYQWFFRFLLLYVVLVLQLSVSPELRLVGCTLQFPWLAFCLFPPGQRISMIKWGALCGFISDLSRGGTLGQHMLLFLLAGRFFPIPVPTERSKSVPGVTLVRCFVWGGVVYGVTIALSYLRTDRADSYPQELGSLLYTTILAGIITLLAGEPGAINSTEHAGQVRNRWQRLTE